MDFYLLTNFRPGCWSFEDHFVQTLPFDLLMLVLFACFFNFQHLGFSPRDRSCRPFLSSVAFLFMFTGVLLSFSIVSIQNAPVVDPLI